MLDHAFLCARRESELTRGADGHSFYTPGLYYRYFYYRVNLFPNLPPPSPPLLVFLTKNFFRPQNLKSMRVLMGHGDQRTVYANFDLRNLNSETRDPTHSVYANYLESHLFLPAQSEQPYWSHYATNLLSDPLAVNQQRGLVNIFPLSLMDERLDKIPPSSALGTLLLPPPCVFLTSRSQTLGSCLFFIQDQKKTLFQKK
jgi:hypothetical protein